MDLLCHRVKRSDLEAGDHVYTWRTGFTYSHHGIYVGRNKVVHFTSGQGVDSGIDSLDEFSTKFSNPREVSSLEVLASRSNQLPGCPNVLDCGFQKLESQVLLSCLDCFISSGSLYRFEYGVSRVVFIAKLRGGTCTIAEADAPEVVIHRAMYLLHNGFGKYDLFENNCEDFALYCKTGLLNPGHKAPGKSGQIYGVVGATLAATCSSLVTTPIAMVAVGASLYSLSRFYNDIGVKTDAIKVEVEDMVEGLKTRAKVDSLSKRPISIDQAETPALKRQKR